MSPEARSQELKDTFLEDMEKTGGNVEVCIRWLRNNAVRAFSQAVAEAEKRGHDKLEQRLWKVIDPNGVPSDIVDAVSRLAQAYRSDSD